MLKKQQEVNTTILFALILLSVIGYYLIGYQIARESFELLFPLFTGLFAIYILFLKYWNKNHVELNTIGILFRVILLFSIPNLSDDIYRFIWDGNLFSNGINPFTCLPSEMVSNSKTTLDLSLFEKLNSPEYYTVYPPFLQYIFGLTSLIFPNNIFASIVFLKSLILLSEIGSIVLITKLLSLFNIDPKYSTLYSLNPLVIVELTGNVHFEAVMIFFLLFTIYFLQKNKYLLSILTYSLAISSKLIPLMFLPFMFRRLGFAKGILISILTLIINLLLFIPFIDQTLIQNFFDSISLYFQTFEFNASIYYLIRWIGYKYAGYNVIKTAGIILPAITTLSIFILAFKERIITYKHLPVTMFVSLIIYLMTATTIHPWYITPLVAFTPFVKTRVAIAWSATAILSYFAYSNPNFTENMLLISLEYLVISGFYFWEWRTDRI